MVRLKTSEKPFRWDAMNVKSLNLNPACGKHL